jgi:hypothetical protein
MLLTESIAPNYIVERANIHPGLVSMKKLNGTGFSL